MTDRRPLTAALVAYLRTATGRPVGEAAAPVDAEVPYAIVYPLPGGASWGPTWAAPDEGSSVPYQITSVGLRADQAQLMADKVRQAMLGRTNGALAALAVTGAVVLDREFAGYGGVDREGDIVSIPDSYTLHVTAP